MSANMYRTLPATAALSPTPFTVDIPEKALDELKTLLKYSKVAADTYESVQEDSKYGVTTKWIREAKDKWENEFDWRKHEARINSFPNYIATIVDDDKKEYKLHFVALYSDRPDAIPITFLHGWPGSFLEFLPILDLLRTRYTPATLPYHVIVPSLPGYAFSDAPPLDRDFTMQDAARLFDKLMIGLGFGSGYIVQGGDIGSRIARVMASEHPACKAAHLNFCNINKPPGIDDTLTTDVERAGFERREEFIRDGVAYARMHATRSSTIGIVLGTNPIALLAWIGEKFLDWTDDTPPLQTILEFVSLYWLTETFPSSLYPYRQEANNAPDLHDVYKINKPFGFSYFPKELVPIPQSWVRTTGDLVFWKSHPSGGHFAAVEQPEALLGDVETFVSLVWGGIQSVEV